MEFRAAADIDKDSAEAHWGLGARLRKSRTIYETIDELRKVADLEPENLEAQSSNSATIIF